MVDSNRLIGWWKSLGGVCDDVRECVVGDITEGDDACYIC